MANNGKTSSSLSESILDAFEILAQAEVQSAQFDKTITGIIVSCEDEATGRYKVQYQDAIFYAYSTALDVTYNKGTSVQVKIPNNDFSGRKMIIGTVEENGIDYGTIVEDPLLRYEYIGIDCIGSIEQNDLSSYWDENKNNIILYDKDNNIDNISLNETMVYDNIKQGNSVLLGASIRTEIPDVQRFKGDYGIKYTLTFNDIANVSATVDRYYIVDIDKMSGDPYAYDVATDQIVPFDIDSENFLYIKKIELFAKNFIYQDNSKPADIFISNLRFQAANRIPDEEFAGTALSIITPEGNYFIASEGDTIKDAIAQLRIKGKVADGNLKNIQYYWFIEDLRINKTSIFGYHKYGGRGWRCLNEYNVTEGDESNPISVDYVTGRNTITIKKDNSKAKETKYKCVINYNNQVLDKEFSFINYDVVNDVNIIYDRDPNFIDSIGATTLTCIATNASTYQWARIDAEGGFEALRDTAAENKEYENAVSKYNELQSAIENKTEPNNATNQALLKTYQNVIQKYNNIERRKENKIINLQAGTIYKEATYKCQAFDGNGTSLGIGTQLVTNYSKANDELQTGNLIINNGSQIFKYNAKGIAPTSEQFENPQTILPLSFTLRNAAGIEIPMSTIRDTDVRWIVPIKNTMINKYFGSVVSHDEDLGVEVYNGKSLGYNINENYYANKDSNEIELQVKYQDLVYVTRTNLIFTKDGDNGTNGTEYVLKVLPSTDTIGRLKTVKAGQSGSDWFRIQLWYNGIKIYEDNRTGNASTGKQVKLTWSIIGDKRSTHNIEVTNNNTNPPLWRAKSEYINTATDIAKATVEYDGIVITATAPVIFSPNLNNSNYKVSIKEGTGFTHVVYSEDGKTPNYDSHTPFEIEVQKLINGQWGIITGDSDLSYSWSTIGNLKIKNGYTSADAAIMFEPVGSYNSEETNNAVICILKENSTTIGTLHIPIHFLLNTYGHSAINEWDGNSIQLDADGNTMLLAPQAGFGKKETNNSYTGVLLGTVKDYTNGGLEHTGMFGYNKGTRTMFLNSKNGAAIFGSVGGAQVVIDPAATTAKLYSNDFYKNYDSKTGLPSSYTSSNENGKGALIDLTTPEIRWGNGNFKVDKNGHITAKGGGTIAGWNIDDTALFTGTKDSNSNVQIASSNFKRTINGTSREDWRMTFSNNFGVSSSGVMHAASGIIGSGTNKITLGKSSGDEARSALYSGSKSKFDANASGFYLGTDGIALGSHNGSNSAFQVNSSGQMIARSGYIGNGTSGWTIGNSSLYNTKNALNHNSNGVFIGTNGIGLGSLVDYKDVTGASSTDNHSKFEVRSDGTLYANNGNFRGKIVSTSGKIGGWTIGSSYLRGAPATSNGTDYIQINSNGSITSPNWSLNRNGAATFSNVTITGGSLNINDKFKVDKEGAMTSTNATVTGKVTATSGKIGNWTINEGAISSNNVILQSNGTIRCKSGDTTYWYIANDGSASFGKGNLKITTEGNVTAKGRIEATSGTIGKCSINDNGNLIVPMSHVTGSLSADRISAGTITGSTIKGGTISGATIKGGIIEGDQFKVGDNTTITDSVTIVSLDSVSSSVAGEPQAMGGIALTKLNLSFGIRTIKLTFSHGLLTNGMNISGGSFTAFDGSWS